jgi:hypothetical protein
VDREGLSRDAGDLAAQGCTDAIDGLLEKALAHGVAKRLADFAVARQAEDDDECPRPNAVVEARTKLLPGQGPGQWIVSRAVGEHFKRLDALPHRFLMQAAALDDLGDKRDDQRGGKRKLEGRRVEKQCVTALQQKGTQLRAADHCCQHGEPRRHGETPAEPRHNESGRREDDKPQPGRNGKQRPALLQGLRGEDLDEGAGQRAVRRRHHDVAQFERARANDHLTAIDPSRIEAVGQELGDGDPVDALGPYAVVDDELCRLGGGTARERGGQGGDQRIADYYGLWHGPHRSRAVGRDVDGNDFHVLRKGRQWGCDVHDAIG